MSSFKNQNKPTIEELKYIIKNSLILVTCTYAHVKSSNITQKLIDDLCNVICSRFYGNGIKTNEEYQNFVEECSEQMVILFPKPSKTGFSFFCINLIIKSLAPMLDEMTLKSIDVPLNKRELSIIGSPYTAISQIKDFESYKIVMKKAMEFSLSKGMTPYQWELEEYNKQFNIDRKE